MAEARYPHLSLKHIEVDRALARALPRGLAFYYLALPLGRDEDQWSVVMAHPEDRAALNVLHSVLGLPVVPVQGDAHEIRAALEAVWREDAGPQAPRILTWGTAPATEGAAPADLIAQALGADITRLDATLNSLETALTVAREGGYSLMVVEAALAGDPSKLVRASSMPLLFVHGQPLALRHILLVLRGHSPDESALGWIIPLAQAAGASVTLLAVAPQALPFSTPQTRMLQGLAVLLYPDNGLGAHVFECARQIDEAGVQGYLKLRQGPPHRQIADEIAEGSYDLIAIAAEAHGDFVQEVLREVENRALHIERPVLVIKPAIP